MTVAEGRVAHARIFLGEEAAPAMPGIVYFLDGYGVDTSFRTQARFVAGGSAYSRRTAALSLDDLAPDRVAERVADRVEIQLRIMFLRCVSAVLC